MNQSENFARFAGTEAVSGDLKRKSVLGALTTGAGGAVDFVVRLGSTLILARLLLPEHFGLVAMVTAITNIAERFSNLGLSTATVQAPQINHAQCSNLFWINVAAGLSFATILALSAPAVAYFYEDARLQAIAIALSLKFVATGVTVQHEALLLRQMKLAQIAGNHLTGTLLSVCVAIALALSGFGYWALVWKEVSQSLAIAAGAWALCRWAPSRPNRHVKMDQFLRFGRDLTITQLLFATASQLDSVLIGRFGGAVALGWYRQAYNLMMAPIERLNAPIYSVSQPGLSVLQFEPERYRRYYERIILVVSLVTIPLGVFTAIYAHEIVLVALGKEWLGAVVYLRIFGLVAVIQPVTGTSGLVLVTRGRSGRFLALNLVYSATLVLLMFLGIQGGAVGIATARLATLALVTPWALWYCFSTSPVSVGDFVRTVSRPLTASVTMGAALLLLRYFGQVESAVVSLLVASGAAATVYFLAFKFLPGGTGQLQSLASELWTVVRQRYPAKGEAGEE